jgi:DNA-directed RNA polymerase specialized sigma24 family protein
VDPDRSKVVELRFFGGLTLDETAEALGVTKRTVQNHWTVCSAWLRRELTA